MNRIPLAALTVGAVAVAAATAACGDYSDSDTSASAVISGISILDAAGFHAIDESINDDGEVPADAATVARKAQTIVNLTDWPDDLDGDADSLEGIFASLATELEKDEPDMTAAGELATQAHDGLHDFSHEVWAHLEQEAGIEAHDEEGHE